MFIAFITTLTLLLSSVSVSVQANEPVLSSSFLTLVSSKLNSQLHPVECAKTFRYSEASGHHCCASICLLKLPTSQSITIASQALPTLVPRGLDDIGEAISRSQTLFRPPIA
jgi:hypothetical protein